MHASRDSLQFSQAGEGELNRDSGLYSICVTICVNERCDVITTITLATLGTRQLGEITIAY